MRRWNHIHRHPQAKSIIRPMSAATSPVGVSNRCRTARASGATHKSYDDVAACEEVEVIDPRHPLYGRRYRLISIGKETITRGACKGSLGACTLSIRSHASSAARGDES
jgi:hypothetical protein